MNIEENNKQYFDFLRTLKEADLKTFLEDFNKLTSYNERETYLKSYYCKDVLNILINENFIKGYYVDTQAKYLKENLKSDIDLNLFSTLVYSYNTTSREFNKANELKDFESKVLSEGYKKINNTQKELNGLNVFCYTDISKIGLLGSFEKIELIQGKLFYSEGYKALMIIPKGRRTKGYIIVGFAYIKEIK